MADIQKVRAAVKAYFDKEDFTGSFAGYRAVQASFALMIADNATLDDAAKDLAFQAIALSINSSNTNWFFGAGGHLGMGGSKLYSALTGGSKKVTLSLDKNSLDPEHVQVLATLTARYGKGDIVTSQILLTMLTNVLKSGIPAAQKKVIIDLWRNTVQMFSSSSEKMEGAVAERVNKLDENHVKRLTSNTVNFIRDTLEPHGASYDAILLEIRETQARLNEAIATLKTKIDSIRADINKLDNHFGIRDRLLVGLAEIEKKLESPLPNNARARSNSDATLANLHDKLVFVNELSEKLGSVKGGLESATGLSEFVNKIKERVAEYKARIALLKKEPDSLHRQEKLEKIISDLEGILLISAQSIFTEGSYDFSEDFAEINAKKRHIYSLFVKIDAEIFKVNEYDTFIHQVSTKIGLLLSEMSDEKGFFAQSRDLDGIKDLLKNNLIHLQKQLKAFAPSDENSRGGIVDFDAALQKLKDIAAQISLIEGGVEIQKMIGDIVAKVDKLDQSVRALSQVEDYKDRQDEKFRHQSVQKAQSQVRSIRTVLATPCQAIAAAKSPQFTATQFKALETKYTQVQRDIQGAQQKVKTIEIEDSFSTKLGSACRKLFKDFVDFVLGKKPSPVASSDPSSAAVGFFPELYDAETTYHERAMEDKLHAKNLDVLTQLVKTPYLKTKADKESFKTNAYYLLRVNLSTMKNLLHAKGMTPKSQEDRLVAMEKEISEIFEMVESQYPRHIKSSRNFDALLPKLRAEFSGLRAELEIFKRDQEYLTPAERNFKDTADAAGVADSYLVDDGAILAKALARLIADDKGSSASHKEVHAYYLLRKLLKIMDRDSRGIFEFEVQLMAGNKSVVELDLEKLSKELDSKAEKLNAAVQIFAGLLGSVKEKLAGHSPLFGQMLRQFEAELQNFKEESLPKVKSVQALVDKAHRDHDDNIEAIIGKFKELIKISPERAQEEEARILALHPGLKAALDEAREEVSNPEPVVEEKQAVKVSKPADVFVLKYHLVAVLINRDENITDVVRENKGLHRKPILFKQNDKFYVYGRSAKGIWQAVELTASDELRKLEFSKEPAIIGKYDLPASAGREVVSKEAHTPVISNDEAFGILESSVGKENSMLRSYNTLNRLVKDIFECLKAAKGENVMELDAYTMAMRERFEDQNDYVVSPRAFLYLDKADLDLAIKTDPASVDTSCINDVINLQKSVSRLLHVIKSVAALQPGFLDRLNDETVVWIARDLSKTLFPNKNLRSREEERLVAAVQKNLEKREKLLQCHATRDEFTEVVAKVIEDMIFPEGVDRLRVSDKEINRKRAEIVSFSGDFLTIDNQGVKMKAGVGAHQVMAWYERVGNWTEAKGTTNKGMIEFSKRLEAEIRQKKQQGGFLSDAARTELAGESLQQVTMSIKDDLTKLFSDAVKNKENLLKVAKLIYSERGVEEEHKKAWRQLLSHHQFTEEFLESHKYASSAAGILDFMNSRLLVLWNSGKVAQDILRSKASVLEGEVSSGESLGLEYRGNPPQLYFSAVEHQPVSQKSPVTEREVKKSKEVDTRDFQQLPEGEVQGQQMQLQMAAPKKVEDHMQTVMERNKQVHELEVEVQQVTELFQRCAALVKAQGEGVSGYDMVLLSVSKDEKDIIGRAKSAAVINGKSYPVLIRQGEKIYVYGDSFKGSKWDGDSLVLTAMNPEKLSHDTLKSLQAERTPVVNKYRDQLSLLKFNGINWEAIPLRKSGDLTADEMKFPADDKTISRLDSCALSAREKLHKQGANKNWRMTEVGTFADSDQLVQELAFPSVGQAAECVEGHKIDPKVYEQVTKVQAHLAPCIGTIMANIESAKAHTQSAADHLEGYELAHIDQEVLTKASDNAQDIAISAAKAILPSTVIAGVAATVAFVR